MDTALDAQTQCDNSIYPYPPGCQHQSTKDIWRDFIHSPYTVLGFAVGLLILLLVVVVLVTRRGNKRKASGKPDGAVEAPDRGVNIAPHRIGAAERRQEA